MAGAGATSEVVRLAGFASLIAGAFSMAVGEYISMRGQVELLQNILKVERIELTSHPEKARSELREVLMADGMCVLRSRLRGGSRSDTTVSPYGPKG